MISNNKILIELIEHQLKDVSPSKKLSYSDLKRISKYLTSSIFNIDNNKSSTIEDLDLSETESIIDSDSDQHEELKIKSANINIPQKISAHSVNPDKISTSVSPDKLGILFNSPTIRNPLLDSNLIENNIISSKIKDDNCSLWNGYITVMKNDDKNSYINFYYNGKKYALHRLLYVNFIGPLDDNEYIKFKCINKGKCCNINHFFKLRTDSPVIKPIEITESKKKILDNITINFNL